MSSTIISARAGRFARGIKLRDMFFVISIGNEKKYWATKKKIFFVAQKKMSEPRYLVDFSVGCCPEQCPYSQEAKQMKMVKFVVDFVTKDQYESARDYLQESLQDFIYEQLPEKGYKDWRICLDIEPDGPSADQSVTADIRFCW